MTQHRRRRPQLARFAAGTISLGLTCLAATEATAATAAAAYANTIAWLERTQNADGTWGSGPTTPMVTAEVLNALASAAQCGRPSAQKAIAWLRTAQVDNLDYRARAVRALEACGQDMVDEGLALRNAPPGIGVGWGPLGAESVNAFDTALVLSGARASGVGGLGSTVAFTEVGARALRQDPSPISGLPIALWVGEKVPPEDVAAQIADGTLGIAITAEVVRATAWIRTDATIPEASKTVYRDGLQALLEYPLGASTDTLEVALRLAARHAWSEASSALEAELLSDARFSAGAGELPHWTPDDPLVHALGLLAIRTNPSFSPPPGDGDAFPFDPAYSTDFDADGIPDDGGIDTDHDGDGVLDAQEPAAFRNDPTEWADADGDGIGDNDDLHDDADGISDLDEAAQETDPRVADSDGDGHLDGVDACPTRATGGAVDGDGDGVCDGDDACDDDPFEVADADGDQICDVTDLDDDDDGFLDFEEIAFGSDPRDAASNPQAALLADPNGDFDRDGLTNAAELSTHDTSPLRTDTDSDGASDAHELGSSTDPLLASSQPKPVIAVFSNIGTPSAQPPGTRHTATGGQSSPAGRAEAFQAPLVEPIAVNLSGFQPQTAIGRDLDGDGLAGLAENAQRTSNVRVDSDGDGFVDGAGDEVLVADHPTLELYNLDGAPDPYADGEADFGSDPADGEEHPGKAGDVAPLFHPDAVVDAADAALLLRIAADPSVAADGGSQNEAITLDAADTDGDARIGADDALQILRQAGESP